VKISSSNLNLIAGRATVINCFDVITLSRCRKLFASAPLPIPGPVSKSSQNAQADRTKLTTRTIWLLYRLIYLPLYIRMKKITKTHFLIFGALLVIYSSRCEAKQGTLCKSGLLISQIETGSVFEKLGLKNDDCLTTYNGKPFSKEKNAKKLLDGLFRKPGTLKIKIIRAGKVEEITYDVK
jgi:hypothetical protein